MKQPQHKYLIAIEVQDGEIYLNLHQDKTVAQVIKDTSNERNHVCFALTPENALELAKGMIDIAYTGKIIDKAIASVELDLRNNE